MRNSFRNVKRDTVFLSVIFTALGLLFLLAPDTSGYIICYIVGGILCLWGALRALAYFRAGKAGAFGSYGLVQGTALLAVGISALLSPAWLEDLLGHVFGLILIVDGALKLQHAVDMLRMKTGRWWAILLTALAVIAVGLVAFFDPFSTHSGLMLFIGACLVANGVADLITVIHISGQLRKLGAAETDLLEDEE